MINGRGLRETDPLEPDSPYGISKLAAEHYIRTMFPNHVICRFGNIYGPRQVSIGENQVIPRMLNHIRQNAGFSIHGSGKQERDFIYVGDVVAALFEATLGDHGTYNIATGKSHSVNEIARIVEDLYGLKSYDWHHTTQEDPRRSVRMDVSRSTNELCWKAQVSLADGIRETVGWWEASGK